VLQLIDLAQQRVDFGAQPPDFRCTLGWRYVLSASVSS
jgi:hypothetical protein